MPISNLNNTHLTAAQQQAITNALNALETALAPLTVNLTPQERKEYGRINEQNKLIVDKVQTFYTDSPQLARPDINWPEFLNDYNSRRVLEKFITRINGLRDRFVDAKTLHDNDNYTNAIEDYGYVSYMAASKTPGYKAKHEELKQFFTRRKSGGDTNTDNSDQAHEDNPDR